MYNNALSAAIGPGAGPGGLRLWLNLGLLALILCGAALRGYGAAEIGADVRRLWRGASIGVGAGLALATLPVTFFAAAPGFAGGPIENEGITSMSGAALAFHLGVRMPLSTALFEELAFRGALFAAVRRMAGVTVAGWWTAGVFSLWHVVITSMTVAESGVVDAAWAVALGVAVSLTGLFVGGLVFAWLRWRLGSVYPAAALHWSIVAAMTPSGRTCPGGPAVVFPPKGCGRMTALVERRFA